jgi:Flp pilus assembly pilin Flp
MSTLYAGLNRFLAKEDAPTMAEYGLLLLFIALAVAASALVLGSGISTLFNAAGTAFEGATIPTIP